MSDKPTQETTNVNTNVNVNTSVSYSCGQCGTSHCFNKTDNIKCKICNNRVFYKNRKSGLGLMYVAV